MKPLSTYALTFFLIISMSYLLAQSSFPLPEDNPSWIVRTASFWQGGAVHESTYRYGDVINHCGFEYIEVLREYDPTPVYLVGYIRIEGSKVYALHDGNLDCLPGEALMYDFSLGSGNSATCGYNMSAQWENTSVNDFNVESTFTQEIFGVDRNIQEIKFNRYPGNTDYVSDQMYWAEGIGSNINPFYSLACIGDQCEVEDTLYQVYYGDELVYQALSIINSVTPVQAMSFQVYPTVFDNEITIQGEQLAQSFCSIFDAMGRNVYQRKLSSSQEKTDLSLLQSGLYFVKVTDQSGNANVKKIIKQ